jgi:hypothetical protein
MRDVIIFTHIPKTSGVSLLRELIEPNFRPEQMYGYRKLNLFVSDMRKDYRFVRGHVPYGLHRFTNRSVQYITFLRDPIDRAISFYYFVQQDGENPATRHPLCDYAESVTLKKFYENTAFQDYQTRFLCGFLSLKYHWIFGTKALKPLVLKTAIGHLKNNYACFGLLEKRDESLELFRHRFGWGDSQSVPHMKKTRNRPRVNDVDAETLAALKAGNSLDIQLYNHATQLFNANYQSFRSGTSGNG